MVDNITDLVVFGNAAEDILVIPDKFLYVNGPELAFVKDGVQKKVRIQGDSIRADEKPRFEGMTIDDVLEGISYERDGGGGGLHSAVWLAQNGIKPLYLDVSASKDVVSKRLKENGISSMFLGYRQIPKNLILDLRKFGFGKVVVRGSKLDRVEKLEEKHLAELSNMTKHVEFWLVNTPKDQYVVSRLMREVPYNAKLMFVFSDSLPRNFVMDELMPRGISAISRKGLNKFGQKLGIKDGSGSLHYAADAMRAIRSRTLSTYPLLAVTEGEGLMCSAWNTIYNVYIDPDTLGKNPTTLITSRAEDVLVAAILKEYMTKDVQHPIETAISASIAELNHRGYTGARTELFRVEVVPRKPKEVYAGK